MRTLEIASLIFGLLALCDAKDSSLPTGIDQSSVKEFQKWTNIMINLPMIGHCNGEIINCVGHINRTLDKNKKLEATCKNTYQGCLVQTIPRGDMLEEKLHKLIFAPIQVPGDELTDEQYGAMQVQIWKNAYIHMSTSGPCNAEVFNCIEPIDPTSNNKTQLGFACKKTYYDCLLRIWPAALSIKQDLYQRIFN